ncbi:heavy metal-binding domain-containing protein [Alicyclobacillus sp. TC]|nr:heavy metal-binding domain-containing protein [Alicyclobacillus sp. TC]
MPSVWFSRKNQGGLSKSERLAKENAALYRSERAIAAFERGQLPEYVEARARKQVQHELPWTSNLSVAEWALLARYGLRPLGQVMGATVYHQAEWKMVLGRQNRYAGGWNTGFNGMYVNLYSGSCFLNELEQGMYEARWLALQRLRAEAALLGAHAVVGVKVKLVPGTVDSSLEMTAMGTAITLDLPSVDEPLLCTVSAQDFVRLVHAGSIPVGLALGVGIYYQVSQWNDVWQSGSYSNQEMYSYTDAVYQARHRAVQEMRRHAAESGGNGVLAHETGLRVEEVEVEYGEGDIRLNHVVEFFAMGTAISHRKTHLDERPQSVVSLNT